MQTDRKDRPEQFVLLSRWCSTASEWADLAEHYASVGAAETAAVERGIYRVVVVWGGRRLALEPFGVIGSHPADVRWTATTGSPDTAQAPRREAPGTIAGPIRGTAGTG